MAEAHLDITNHGEVHWFKDYGPQPVQPFTGQCKHWGQEVIAWGWDWNHYELVKCSDCQSRAWSTERGVITTPWMTPPP